MQKYIEFCLVGEEIDGLAMGGVAGGEEESRRDDFSLDHPFILSCESNLWILFNKGRIYKDRQRRNDTGMISFSTKRKFGEVIILMNNVQNILV